MSQNVWSAQFIVYTSSTPNQTFLVPAGYTAVVRYASVTQDIGGYTAIAGFKNSDAAPGCAFWENGGLSEFTSYQWQGRVVVPGGGTIYILLSSVGSSPSFYVGGYLLRDSGS